MKTKLILTFLLLAVCYSVKAQQPSTPPVDKIPITIINTGVNHDIERSINFPSIEAYIVPSLKILELSLHNLGEATICIMGTYGNIYIEDSTPTDIPITLNLDVSNLSGSFYIIITSPRHHAEGFFTL